MAQKRKYFMYNKTIIDGLISVVNFQIKDHRTIVHTRINVSKDGEMVNLWMLFQTDFHHSCNCFSRCDFPVTSSCGRNYIEVKCIEHKALKEYA